MCLRKVLKVFHCGFSLLPGRSSDKISFQQPQLAEQNPVDKRHGGQLLQGEMGLKLEFLLFHKESHCCCFFNLATQANEKEKEDKSSAESKWKALLLDQFVFSWDLRLFTDDSAQKSGNKSSTFG